MNRGINLYMETSMGIISIPFVGLREVDLFTTSYNSRFDKDDLNNKSKLLDVLINVLKLPISVNDIGRVYLSYEDIESVEFNYDTCLPIRYSKDNYNIDSLIENFSLFLKRDRSRLDYPGIKNVGMNTYGDFSIDTISERNIDIIANLFLDNNYKRMREVYFYLTEIDSPTEKYNIKIDKMKDEINDRKEISKLESSEDSFVQYLIELSSRDRNKSGIVMDEFSKIELEDVRKELGNDSKYIFDGLSSKNNNIEKDIANLEECTGINIEILRDICSSQINNGRGR